MGCGSYTAQDWDKLRKARDIDNSSVKELFGSQKMLDKYNPYFIARREAHDSDEHPNSTPIAIGVDVTGSMGYLSEEIIKNGLNELMKKLYASQVIPDPQLMFAACGDYDDIAPLQVTQFESDIRIAEQLLELWLEGHGCGNRGEDYQLLWYFLANHTDIDCYNKRNIKGFAFTIGDEPVHNEIRPETFKKVFNEADMETMATSEAIKECEEKYHLFHIAIDKNYYDVTNVIPGKTILITKEEVTYLPEIIITVICKVKGLDASEILGDLDPTVEKIIAKAIKNVVF